MITTICYGEKTIWANRAEAINFYAQGVAVCSGSEAERYANILCGLLLGLTICKDE